MVQGWYQGGVSVFDFTDSARPVEIAFFDRGPYNAEKLIVAGYWSTYWYNGYIYGSEIGRGVDVFRLTPSEFLTKNEIDAAALVRVGEFNAQHQPRLNWPASFVVARAYLDQLTRSKGLAKDRATVVRTAIDRAERLQPGPARRAALDGLVALTTQLDADAGSAGGRDAERLQMLAATIRLRAAELR
jgi:hypothetical protein